jgi:tetratricopeptide (TPR) repeat protein
MKTPKIKERVVVFTDEYKIEGEAHLFQNSRLSELLNSDSTKKEFIPLTDVTVYEKKTGNILFQTDFLNLNKKSIVIIYIDNRPEIRITKKLSEARKLINYASYPEARKILNEIIEMDDKNAEAIYLRGLVYRKEGKYSKGLDDFYLVKKITPPESHHNILATDMINYVKV